MHLHIVRMNESFAFITMVSNHRIYFEYTLEKIAYQHILHQEFKMQKLLKAYLRYIVFEVYKCLSINNENISATKVNLVTTNVRVGGKKLSIRHLAIILRSIYSDAEFAKNIPSRRKSIFPFGKSNISPLQDPIQCQGFDDYNCQQVFMKWIFYISSIELNTLFFIYSPSKSQQKKQ